MVDVQIGTKSLPVLVRPRIDGKFVTVTDIKNNFSNFYIDDNTTPIEFFIEYKKRETLEVVLKWDSVKSTDSTIFFPIPNDFYTSKQNWTVLVYWTIATEKIYTIEAITISVKDLHI